MSDHWEAAPRHMMRLDIRSLLQDAAIEEVRISVLVKITNYVDVTILKIRSREKYSHNRAGILGTVESQNHCQTNVFHFSYQLPKHEHTCCFLSPFWSPNLGIFEQELKLLCS